MLTDLSIRNFALVEHLDLELGPGLLCITGETGAGKSILVNALSFLLGERAQAEFIRTGADSCEVTAVFTAPEHDAWATLTAEMGLEPASDWVLRRDFNSAGRSRVWINDRPATVQSLKQVGELLCDLHGQHQHQWLLDPERHRDYLDAFVDADVISSYRIAFASAQAAHADLQAARKRLEEFEKQRDFWAFQLKELDAVDPQPGEYEDLLARRDRIRHAAELDEVYRLADAEISGADNSLAPRLHDLCARLKRAADRDPELAEWAARLDDARAIVDEVGTLASRRLIDAETEPDNLDYLEERLHKLYRLKKKFNDSLDDAIAERRELQSRLASLENGAVELSDLEAAWKSAESSLADSVRALHHARLEASATLRTQLHTALEELGLTGDPVHVNCDELPRAQWHDDGPDRIEFLFAANRNEIPKALSKVVSGGELSRVMLALKSVMPGADRVGTLIFDEIDSGVSGAAATRVAERLQRLAAGRQVMVITHLHPIAARADIHWTVEKVESDGRMIPQVRQLNAAERVEELSKLIAGGDSTKESRAAARALVKPKGRR